MMNTIVNFRQQADLGMPASERVRVASLRALPTTGATTSASGQKCARIGSTSVTGYTPVAISDLAVVKGAFPGTSAWSPPRR